MELKEFLSSFQGGFQRTARFRCQIFVPAGLLDYVAASSGPFTANPDLAGRQSVAFVKEWLARGLLVESARLPSRGLETIDLTMYGISESFPYHSEYTELDCTFLMPIVRADNPVPKLFNYWQNYVHNAFHGPRDGLDFRFPNLYYGTILLHMFDTSESKDIPSVSYQFDNVYPKTVESVSVDWNSADEMAKQGVGFIYSYWRIVPGSTISPIR